MNLDIKIDDITHELLDTLIGLDWNSPEKEVMRQAEMYYQIKNPVITDRMKKMVLYDANEKPYLKDDLSKPNRKVKHGYLRELIEQCTSYLAGKPLKLDYKTNTMNMEQKLELDNQLYKENDFVEFICRNITNVQLYGKSLFRIVKDQDRLVFVIYDPKEIAMFYNDYDEPILAIRHFHKVVLNDSKTAFEKVRYAEVYNHEYKDTWAKPDKANWGKISRELVYGSKATFSNGKGEVIKEDTLSFDVGTFPIIEWKFNHECTPTIANIKDFIDLQDLDLSDLANDIESIQEAVWILENYNGQNLQEFMSDLKEKKAIKVGVGGSAHSETVQIPIEARNKLYELCNKNIYKFGMGVDFSERSSLGNVTGVGLKWSYAPLEQKANQIENHGQEPLNKFFTILFKLMGLDFDSNDLEFIFDRSMIINEQEITSTIMSASAVLSERTVYDNLPMVRDTDEEIKRKNEENVYDEPDYEEEATETGEDLEAEVEQGDEIILVGFDSEDDNGEPKDN